MGLEAVPTGQWDRDNLLRQPLSIGSVPVSGTIQVTVTVPAGDSGSWTIFFSTANQHLSDWNFAVSMVVDDNTTLDSEGHWAYRWPAGTSLPSAVETNVFMSSFIDWGMSSDISNQRAFVIWFSNKDTADHTLYLYTKGYTQSVNAGGT